MKKEDVPQDNNRTYGGHRKVIYATNADGRYEAVDSSGWEAEEFATLMAVDELEALTKAARQRVLQGLSSPLEYHMYAKRLDVVGLSQATGFFQWQIRRHLRPDVFRKLPEKKIARYCDALGLTASQLGQLPDHQNNESNG